MNRRRFVTAVASLAAFTPCATRAAFVPPVAFEGEDFALVAYIDGEEEGVRTLTASVSRWADAESAEEFRQKLDRGAGSDLPLGEFYQSEPVKEAVPAALENLPASLTSWHTIVGAAGLITEWVLLTVRRDTLLWDLRVSGATQPAVQDLAATLAADLTSRDDDGELATLLPAQDAVPAPLRLDHTMSPEGTFNAEGTPIPEPTAAPQ